MNGFLAWLHGVITALKPVVGAFFRYLGAMIANRPAPAGGVVVAAAVLVMLTLFVPRVVKKMAKSK